MAGLYIHIPFCKSRCRYCDFYSTILVGQQSAYVKALQKEMLMRSDYLGTQQISTIYFGGGTPSTVNPAHYRDIFHQINRIFKLSYPLEITFEANPCDLNRHYINELKENMPEINRLSIGIQSFNDDELFLLGRRHNASNAKESIHLCQEKGFNNISIDLIYGIPGQTLKSWQHSIQTAIDLNVTHISAYNLTYEEGTKLDEMRRKQKIAPVSDELCEQFYMFLCNRLRNAGFVRYEVSNFARRTDKYPLGVVSNHNASYWNNTHYLGFGAAAHSYNGVSRSWNVASIHEYIEKINRNVLPSENEVLDDRARYNEFVMTRLRTAEGISLTQLEKLFGYDKKTQFLAKIKHLEVLNMLKIEGEKVKVPEEKFFVSDFIIREIIEL